MGVAPPPYYGRGRSMSLEEFMALVRVPCEPPAAAALARSVSRRALAGALFGAVFTAVALGIASMALSAAPAGVAGLVFALFVLTFVVVGSYITYSSLRYYRGLSGLASVLEQGLLPREQYCGKTLLEVYYSYKSGAVALPVAVGV